MINSSYYDYNLPIDILINNKFKIANKYNKYDLIELFLFIKKIWDYEPNIVFIINQFHNVNYSYIVDFYEVNIRKPIRMNACCYYDDNFNNNFKNNFKKVSKLEDNFKKVSKLEEEDDEYDEYDEYGLALSICSCTSCDLYGYYLLKPYRINKLTLLKLVK